METIREDSFILVYRDRRKKWLVRPVDTPKLHTHLGILDCTSLVGKPFGTVAATTMNDSVYILKPTLEDISHEVREEDPGDLPQGPGDDSHALRHPLRVQGLRGRAPAAGPRRPRSRTWSPRRATSTATT
jgi:hypothetical protein